MLAPETIQNALVTAYRDIPALVALMASSAAIRAYVDEFPGKTDLLREIREAEAGSLIIAHLETGPGLLNRMEAWKHRFAAYVKPKGKMSAVWAEMVNGIPASGDGLPMLLTESLNPKLHRMDTPRIVRQFLQVTETSVIDYFEVTLSFAEKGI